MKKTGFILSVVFFLMIVSTTATYSATMSVSIEGMLPEWEIESVTLVWDVSNDFSLTNRAVGDAIPIALSMGWMDTANHNSGANTFAYGNADWDYLSISTANPMLNGTIITFEHEGTIEGCSNHLFFDISGSNIFDVPLINVGTWITDGEMRFGNAVPIPGAIWLLFSGIIGLVGIRRRFAN